MEERLGINEHKKKLYILEYIVILLAIWLTFELITYLAEPTIMELCKVRAESLGISISNKAVQEVMNDVGYLDLIILDRDENGKILALRANVIEMNRIATEISIRIQEMNNELKESFVRIAGRGPALEVKLIPTGTVSIEFKTEFISTGINQTRHRVYLEIKSKMGIVAPFTSERVEVVNHVNVAETVLIGDVPDTFYNLEKLNEITPDTTLNLWQ